MVELARFQAGDSELKLSHVTAEEIIVKTAKRAKEIQRSHRLVSSIEPDLPSMSLDSQFIVEAVFNLIENAAKYSPRDTKIEIAAEKRNGTVRFTVEDEGVFTKPWSGVVTYERPAMEWPENVCAENTFDFFAEKSGAGVPTANKPDF